MSPKTALRTLSTIHGALLLALMAFTALAYWHRGSFDAIMGPNDIFVYAVPLAAGLGYFMGKYMFQRAVRNIKREEGLAQKLQKYLGASLVKYALAEAPALFALAAYYLNGNALHLVIAVSLVAYLLAQRPTAQRLIKDVPLNLEEQKQFDTLRP